MSREWVSRLILAKAVLDEWTGLHAGDRREAIAAMERGDRLNAPDGLGELNLSDPKGTYVVADRTAFFHWVKTHAPHGLREVVDPTYEKAILAKGCDGNGEVPDGVEFVIGQPVLSVKPSPAARQLAKAALPALPELPVAQVGGAR